MQVEKIKNKILIIDNHYFTCYNCIKYLLEKSHVKIFASEPYKKMSFRNRCIVAGSNGLVPLSVPIENGRNQKLPFKDVRIAMHENWQIRHWRTLTSCYNKSAFFEYYQPGVQRLFLKEEEFLFDLNLKILFWLKEVLGIQSEIDIDEGQAPPPGPGFIDLRDKWLPKNFQEGEGRAGLKYFQVFENRIGFQPNLSILDLLFNEGPNAAELLKSQPGGMHGQ